MSNWLAMLASIAVGFLLTPFLVHQLGNVAYGVWIAAVASVNYLALLEMGLASSVVRFVSKGRATQDHESASDVLSAVLWVRLQIGGLVLLLSSILAYLFPLLFKVPAALALDAREAILIIGINTTLSLSFGVFSSVLSALSRYDLRSYVALIQLALRVGGVVIVVRAGHGIVAIAFCELFAAAIGNALLVVIARRTYPELRIRIRKPSREVLRQIWSYSFYAFLLTIAGQLVYQSDSMVVGAFISVSAVTFYSFGNSLCIYTRQFINVMTTTFTPAASSCDAAGDAAGMKSLYYNGTRATMALFLPVVITLITRGDNFIGVWIGPQYAKPSGMVLAILAVGILFNLQNAAGSTIAWGVDKHKMMAKWAIPEAIANLTLSIILARTWLGIYGVAIGTLLPGMVTSLILWPRFLFQIVGISFREAFRNVWAPISLCAIPFAIASYVVDIRVPAHNMIAFILQTMALLPIFLVTVGIVFHDKIRRQILPKIRSLLYADVK